MYEGRLNSYKLHPRRKAITKHFSSGNRLSLLLKLEKSATDFCLKLCARKVHTKIKGSATNLKMDKSEVRAVIKNLQEEGLTPKGNR